jgi:hypothetical protein
VLALSIARRVHDPTIATFPEAPLQVGSRNGAISVGVAYLFLSVSSESASLAAP